MPPFSPHRLPLVLTPGVHLPEDWREPLARAGLVEGDEPGLTVGPIPPEHGPGVALGQAPVEGCVAAGALGVLRPDDDVITVIRTLVTAEALARHAGVDRDGLTGLPRRRAFRRSLAGRLGSRPEVPWVMALDLADLRAVNDELGQAAGDAMLQAVAQRLRQRFPGLGAVAHLGGDEFGLWLDRPPHGGLGDLARAVQRAVQVPTLVATRDGAQSVVPRVRVGAVALEADRAEVVLREVHDALRAARRASDGVVARFEPRRRDAGSDRVVSLDSALEEALRMGRFETWYQPVVSVQTGRMVALEALLRWSDAPEGVPGPGHFVARLEQTGRIIAVGQEVLRQVVRDLALWRRDPTLDDLRVHVNVSAQQLTDDHLLDVVDRALARHRLPGRTLGLEITERMALVPDSALLRRLQRLRARGLTLHVDDFGRGYATLDQLRHLPVDGLTIDRAFLGELAQRPTHRVIVDAITTLASELGLEVVAEGVEVPGQLGFLEARGVQQAQGFGLCPPVPARVVPELARLDLRHPHPRALWRDPAVERDAPG